MNQTLSFPSSVYYYWIVVTAIVKTQYLKILLRFVNSELEIKVGAWKKDTTTTTTVSLFLRNYYRITSVLTYKLQYELIFYVTYLIILFCNYF